MLEGASKVAQSPSFFFREMNIMQIGVWLVDIQADAQTDSADYLESLSSL